MKNNSIVPVATLPEANIRARLLAAQGRVPSDNDNDVFVINSVVNVYVQAALVEWVAILASASAHGLLVS